MTPKFLCIHKTAEGQHHWTSKHFHRDAIKMGFSGCRYHYLIFQDGSVEQLRDLKEPGHHCLREKKASNRNSIGVCLVGEGSNTAAQKASLDALIFCLADHNLEIKYAE